MKARTTLLVAGLSLLAGQAVAQQSVLFDFENAAQHTPLPIDLTVGGITAHFSATGQGFSIQIPTDCAGVLPTGFSGLCVCPSSVFAADLLVSYSVVLQDFSILYAPQELACDTSATMRVTGYMDGAFVATATATAPIPGTWPTGVLALSAPQGFNSVVVHWESPGPGCQDYGPIFMADNMTVTPTPVPVGLDSFSVE